ncbi:hypothetical protein [Flavobacterium okayamense]|uniref:Uncharacterized protein n=1 Tax=Flavobacterium okayamense TaxID=2830782 RepID=A0ABN6HW43_9FLAO|nr:hypothetical protein [Flavobacterium okayamense]BCY27672.1 hypothetical protein KK2020170_05400 [Flavobacterium okayamense]
MIKNFQFVDVTQKLNIYVIENTSIISEMSNKELYEPCYETVITQVPSYYVCPEGNHDITNYSACPYYQDGSATIREGYFTISTSIVSCNDTGGSDTGNNDSTASGDTGTNSTSDGSSNTSSGSNTNNEITTLPYEPCTDCLELTEDLINFIAEFDSIQSNYWDLLTDRDKKRIVSFLFSENYSEEAKSFSKEAILAIATGGEVDFALNIIYTINKPCQKEIVKKIMSVSSPLTNLIKNTFNTSENINVKFWNGDISSYNSNTNAYTSPIYNGNSSNYIINIGFDDAFLDNSTDLAIVAVTLHELTHAYFISQYLQGNLNANDSDYENLLNAFIAFYENVSPDTAEPLDNEIHNAMNNYIDQIANGIYNYSQQQNIENVSVDYCIFLAWGTMHSTDLFEEMLTPSQQALANNIFLTEQNNQVYDNAIPVKGTPCE